MSPPERDQGTPELAVCFDEEEEDFVEENEVEEISENGQEVWNVTQSQMYPATLFTTGLQTRSWRPTRCADLCSNPVLIKRLDD